MSKPIAEMGSLELEEYATLRIYDIQRAWAGLNERYITEAAAIGLRYDRLGHPFSAKGWAEAAIMLEKGAACIEQAIKEVSDE